MKKTLLTLTVALTAVGLYAQGTLNFATAGGGVFAKVRDAVASEAAGSDVFASGTGYMAQLYYGAPDASEMDLKPLNRALTLVLARWPGSFWAARVAAQ